MPVPLPKATRPLLRLHIQRPWTRAARMSPGARKWCDKHGFISPHFSWESYRGSDGTAVPAELRVNARRLHWRLELMRHRLGDQPMTIDGPYRTAKRNKEVGGAPKSRHVQADGADFFLDQVNEWIANSPKLRDRDDVLAIASETFFNGGVGNENSGTLHVDSRGSKVRFITW
jgi:hypothetical protein